jgi:2-dehydro-3-deoxyphosphogluconate aldolase/(4S)-4-hydroxy-2-oxoglutarate aldolase
MARFMRLEVVNTLLDIGLVPLFYNPDVQTSIELAFACSRGGAKVIEFTNRGELAYPVFSELVRHCAKQDPDLIPGVGSIIDAPTAALYIAAGANFVVGPSFNPQIARLCNRRKILYMPGCATETDGHDAFTVVDIHDLDALGVAAGLAYLLDARPDRLPLVGH